MTNRPFIPLATALIFGIVSGSSFPGQRFPGSLLILLCSVFVIRGILFNKSVFPFLVILSFSWGYLSIQPYTAPRFPSNHIIRHADKEKWIITGIIDEKPGIRNNRLKFILQVKKLGRNTSATGKLRVSVKGKTPDLSLGDKISFVSKIRSLKNFENPGRYNYEKHMAFKKIWVAAHTSGERIDILEKGSTGNFRTRISRFIDKNTDQKDQNSVLKALITGDKSEIPESVRDGFRRAGIAHLLAISGLHISIVTGFALIVFQYMLSRLNILLKEPLLHKGVALLSLFPLAGYGMLAGMSSSTQRAVIMVAVYLIAFLHEKAEQDVYNTLAIAAMLILAVHPPSLFSVSFQLSFSAVFSIIYGLSKTYGTSIGKQNQFGIKKRLISFFLVSLFAILGTMPVGMYYFNEFSVMGLLANCVFIPLIGFAVVPLGLFSAFLHIFSIFSDSFFIHLSAFVLAIALKILPLFSNTSFAVIKTVTPTFFEICCYYVMGWAVLNIFSRQKLAMAVIVIVIIAGIADVRYWMHKRFWHDDLRVTIMDVRQASAALLEFPGGHSLLIDGGGFFDNSVFDVGERVVGPFLLGKKIRTIDTIVLSHPDSDHLNGLLYIARHFNVKNVWTNNEPVPGRNYQEFREIVGNRMSEFKDIFGRQHINGAELEILYPPKDFMDKKQKQDWRNTNNNSVVVKVRFGSVSFLFPGDIEEEAEKELAETAGHALKSTVLIAPHHGSKTSSTDIFLDHVRPEYVIISASGWRGIPHHSVIRRYEERGYKIFRTDKDGAVSISTDGKSLMKFQITKIK